MTAPGDDDSVTAPGDDDAVTATGDDDSVTAPGDDDAVTAPGDNDAVTAVHDEVDASVAPLVAQHAERLACRKGCAACCVDDLTVFEVEAERIRAVHGALLEKGVPHAEGACAFLDDTGACRIYADRPYVCRTQGLPLRWLVEDAAGDIVERRSICELNATGEALETLDEEACWLIGPVEDRLVRLQALRDGDGTRRVPLRSLFRRSAQRG